ncbi:hypothetical protein D3C71_1652180 [compost metagenome]
MQLHILQLILGVDPLIVIVHRYGHGFFGLFLTDNVLIENPADILGLRNVLQIQLFFMAELFLYNLGTQFNAFIAYIDARTGYQLAHLVLGLAAEGAFQLTLFIIKLKHSIPPPLRFERDLTG